MHTGLSLSSTHVGHDGAWPCSGSAPRPPSKAVRIALNVQTLIPPPTFISSPNSRVVGNSSHLLSAAECENVRRAMLRSPMNSVSSSESITPDLTWRAPALADLHERPLHRSLPMTSLCDPSASSNSFPPASSSIPMVCGKRGMTYQPSRRRV